MNRSQARFPSSHHREEGWPSDQEDVAKHPLFARPGWCPDEYKRKTTPSALSVDASIFLLARPPLLAVMQGGEYIARRKHSRLTP